MYSKHVKSDDMELESGDFGWSCIVCKGMKSDLKSIKCALQEMEKLNETCFKVVEDQLLSLDSSVKDSKKCGISCKTYIAESINKDIADSGKTS